MHVNYSEFRQNLTSHMDRVIRDHAELVVTRQAGQGNVVVVSEEDWAGLQTTIYLLSNPANAAHLLESVAQANAGNLSEHDLVEP